MSEALPSRDNKLGGLVFPGLSPQTILSVNPLAFLVVPSLNSINLCQSQLCLVASTATFTLKCCLPLPVLSPA